MFDKVASAVFKRHSDHIDSKHDTSFVNPVNMSEAGKGKLSYFLVTHELAEICLQELFQDIIKRFCRIADNKFRKDILTKIGKIKTERLRKRVDAKKPVAMQTVNMKTILNDKSECKRSSHFKIKSCLIDHGKVLFGNFNKKDMLILCKAYDIQISTSSTNDVIKDELCSVIESSDRILFSKYLEETFSSSESNLSSKAIIGLKLGKINMYVIRIYIKNIKHC
ncbi:unnamed protein product [Mytilus coruscus]|uniref:Uncharacterized protein n=1 Tax=Mytilus coruscus TaxID=42192 RepID=A0A6J8AM20_MYTCO|nr:unnamed protein product [Mytilus coruscus]